MGATQTAGIAGTAGARTPPLSNLADLLRSLEPVRNPGVYVFASLPPGSDTSALDPIATIREQEGLTVVVEEERARRAGLPVLLRATWITLNVHSDLQAVGLTAAFSSALAKANLSCNVLAGAFHDHLFVPVESGEKAMTVLRALQHNAARKVEGAMEELPYIDELSQPIVAPMDVVWTALLKVLRRQMGGSARFARLLGCDPAESTTEFAGPGDTVPGFRIAAAEPGRRLVLQGRHRFANYTLTFILDPDRLRAQTHAAFPGVLGRLYRAAVIGSGGHRWVARRMLRQVVRRM